MKKLENIREFMNFTGQEEMNPEFMDASSQDSQGQETQNKMIDFTVPGVADSAVQMICSLISNVILNSAEAEKISRMAKNNPSGAINFIDKKVKNIIQTSQVDDKRLIASLESQSRKIAEYISGVINPMAQAMASDTQINPEEIKPTTSTLSNLSRIQRMT